MVHYSKINNKRMKSINKQHVLNAIRKSGLISRKDLAKKTKLTTGTITNLTEELIRTRWILEKGSGESEGGRKPILLELNPKAGYAIGLELNTSQMICILSDFQGKFLATQRYRVNLEEGKNKVIGDMALSINQMMQDNHIERHQVLGIGLAMPGPINDKEGIINPPNLQGWHNTPIREIIEKETAIKTYVEKETQSAVLGEYWFGQCNGFQRIFQVNVYEIGIGGGFIMNGNLFHANQFCSMELGHTTVCVGGYPCICGSKGCLEAQANGLAAIRYAKEEVQQGNSSVLDLQTEITFDQVIDGAEKRDKACVNAIKKCAEYLSISLINIIGILGPDIIVFGGDFIAKSKLLFQEIVNRLESHPYFTSIGQVKKIRASFGVDAGAIGGIATVLNAISEI